MQDGLTDTTQQFFDDDSFDTIWFHYSTRIFICQKHDTKYWLWRQKWFV